MSPSPPVGGTPYRLSTSVKIPCIAMLITLVAGYPCNSITIANARPPVMYTSLGGSCLNHSLIHNKSVTLDFALNSNIDS